MAPRETDLWSASRLVLVRIQDSETANRCFDSVEYQQILPISKKVGAPNGGYLGERVGRRPSATARELHSRTR